MQWGGGREVMGWRKLLWVARSHKKGGVDGQRMERGKVAVWGKKL